MEGLLRRSFSVFRKDLTKTLHLIRFALICHDKVACIMVDNSFPYIISPWPWSSHQCQSLIRRDINRCIDRGIHRPINLLWTGPRFIAENIFSAPKPKPRDRNITPLSPIRMVRTKFPKNVPGDRE
jgi:hypothetical protein